MCFGTKDINCNTELPNTHTSDRFFCVKRITSERDRSVQIVLRFCVVLPDNLEYEFGVLTHGNITKLTGQHAESWISSIHRVCKFFKQFLFFFSPNHSFHSSSTIVHCTHCVHCTRHLLFIWLIEKKLSIKRNVWKCCWFVYSPYQFAYCINIIINMNRWHVFRIFNNTTLYEESSNWLINDSYLVRATLIQNCV